MNMINLDVNWVTGKKAEEIYDYITNTILIYKLANIAKEDICKACNEIRKADGDRAWVIYNAKDDGWWDQDIPTTCEEIRKAPGDRAFAIYWAKHDGWWDQDNRIDVNLFKDIDKLSCHTDFQNVDEIRYSIAKLGLVIAESDLTSTFITDSRIDSMISNLNLLREYNEQIKKLNNI